MGIMVGLDGFNGYLGESITADSRTIPVCDMSYIDSKMKDGDYVYLIVGDGVNSETVKATYTGGELVIADGPLMHNYPSGASVVYRMTFDAIEKVVGDLFEELRGGLVREAVFNPPTQGTASIEGGVLSLSIAATGEGGEAINLCALEDGAAAKYVGCTGDGRMVLSVPATGSGSGGPNYSQGSGIKISGGSISLEEVFEPATVNGFTIDKHGRVTEATDTGGSTSTSDSLFADGVKFPSGSEYQAVFSVTAGKVTAIEKAGGEDVFKGVQEGAGIAITDQGGYAKIALAELGKKIEEHGYSFDKYGRLTGYEQPEIPYQMFNKVRFAAAAEMVLWTQADDAFEIKASQNIESVDEIERYTNSVDYQINFTRPSPDTNYVITDGGSHRSIREVLEKTETSFTIRVEYHSADGRRYFAVSVLGSMMDPTLADLTAAGFEPA